MRAVQLEACASRKILHLRRFLGEQTELGAIANRHGSESDEVDPLLGQVVQQLVALARLILHRGIVVVDDVD